MKIIVRFANIFGRFKDHLSTTGGMKFRKALIIFFFHLPQYFYTGSILFIGKRDLLSPVLREGALPGGSKQEGSNRLFCSCSDTCKDVGDNDRNEEEQSECGEGVRKISEDRRQPEPTLLGVSLFGFVKGVSNRRKTRR